ncbi:MAG: ABC transporter ATP-binding protein [Mogibacterium sp.]|nr:ABC transporter ATP-binding protein [Mogibacterium sp.]
MSERALVECRALTKRYGRKTALDSIDLKLESGKIIGLLGPNGSGKTTLIKLLNGLIQPTSGEMYIDGQKPGIYTKGLVSYLPDKNYFADWMTVEDLFNIFEDFYSDFNRAKASEMCRALGVNELDKIKTMSKGTREKVQLILVMCREAKLYLLDEPIAGVDPAARDYILNMIISNYADDATIVISTHLVSDIEKILDEVIFIKDGHIVRQSAVDDIKEEEGKSIDELFREEFRWIAPTEGGRADVR